MKTVVFDESGNTGADLMNIDQPIFALASADYTIEEATNLLGHFSTRQATEIKFKNLKRKSSGRDEIVSFMREILSNKERVLTMIYHKEFTVVTHIVDLLIEDVARRQGIDIYKKGHNIALANIHFMSMEVFCGKEISSKVKKSFVKMIRKGTKENIEYFYYACYQAYGACIDIKYKSQLESILASERYIKEILNGLDNHSIDPAIPTFCVHCSTWGDRLNQNFNILHDDSKPLVHEQDLLHLLMNTEENAKKIGYDRRAYSFPFRVNKLEFANSEHDPRLQVVDVIASCTAAWYKGLVNEKYQGELWNLLRELDLQSIAIGAVFPSIAVTPEQLGTNSSVGCNAIDYMASYIGNKIA